LRAPRKSRRMQSEICEEILKLSGPVVGNRGLDAGAARPTRAEGSSRFLGTRGRTCQLLIRPRPASRPIDQPWAKGIASPGAQRSGEEQSLFICGYSAYGE
jgi:hypothetical protein